MGVLARCSTYRGQQPHRSQPSAPTRLLDQAPTPAAPRTAASRGGAQGQQARDPEGKIHRGSKMTTQSTQRDILFPANLKAAKETADQTDPLRAGAVPAADYSDSVVEARLRAGSGCRVPWSSRWHRSMPGQQLREHCEVDHGRSARGVRWFSWMCASPPCASVLVDTRSNSNSESRWPDCRRPNQAHICPAEGTLGRVRCRE